MNANISTTPPAVVPPPSCHGEMPNSSKRFNWRRSIAITAALAAVAGGLAFAVDQRWLSPAALTPLLFTLPCAVMMFVCMHGAHRRTRPDPIAQQLQSSDQAWASPKAS